MMMTMNSAIFVISIAACQLFIAAYGKAKAISSNTFKVFQNNLIIISIYCINFRAAVM